MTFTNVLESHVKFLICLESKAGSGTPRIDYTVYTVHSRILTSVNYLLSRLIYQLLGLDKWQAEEVDIIVIG